MASGYGLTGNVGRCYGAFMDFSECVSKADVPSDCFKLREDYFECLHHRKEVRGEGGRGKGGGGGAEEGGKEGIPGFGTGPRCCLVR